MVRQCIYVDKFSPNLLYPVVVMYVHHNLFQIHSSHDEVGLFCSYHWVDIRWYLVSFFSSGVLNQPFVFERSGLLGAFLGFLTLATCTWASVCLITAAGISEKAHDFSELSRLAFGYLGEALVDCVILIISLGRILVYVLLIGETSAQLLKSWGCNNILCSPIMTIIIEIVGFVLPLCLFRKFGHLTILSLMAIFALILIQFLVIIGGPVQSAGTHGRIVVFNFVGTLASTGSMLFSLSCMPANFQVFVSANKEYQNMIWWPHIVGAAIFIGTFMSICTGIGRLTSQAVPFYLCSLCHACSYTPFYSFPQLDRWPSVGQWMETF